MRKMTILFSMFAAVILAAATAFGWGMGTHAYIASEIGKRGGDPNLNEIYGSTLPDVFNYAFGVECDPDYLYSLTHDTDFLDVYDTKNRGLEKWIAAGLVMHNQSFGMDRTAHIESAVGGWPTGYVNVKAQALNDFLLSPYNPGVPAMQVVMSGMGIDPDPDLILQMYHAIIEYSADLVLSQVYPQVGPTLYAAATFWPYDRPFPLLLVDAFADDISAGCGLSMEEAVDFLVVTEVFHRQTVTYEAYLLAISDPAQALQATASHLATIGIGYLGLPYEPGTPDYDDIHAEFTQLIAGYMQIEMGYFLDDYFEELQATVDLVEQNMIENGIIKK